MQQWRRYDGQLEVMGRDWVGCTELSPPHSQDIAMKTELSHLGCWVPSLLQALASIVETEEKFLADNAVPGRLSLNVRCLCDNITVLTQDKGSHGAVAEAMGLGSLPKGPAAPLLLSNLESLSPFSRFLIRPVKYPGLENPHLRDFSTNPHQAPSHSPSPQGPMKTS